MQLLHIGRKLLAHQKPHVALLMQAGLGVPLSHRLRATPALHFTHTHIRYGAQFLQCAPQNTRRKRFMLLLER
jgi:hypothetical protein